MDLGTEKLCDQNLIPAYIDGELEPGLHDVLSDHFDSCARCKSELRVHQQIACELDAAFTDEIEVSVPNDFSRVVAARAVSDMSGVRSSTENKKALFVCLILAVAGFALIGSTTRQMTFVVARRFIQKIVGLIEFVANTLYDSVASVFVISRVVSRKLIVETGNLRLVVVLLALSVLLLSRLLSSYRRTGAIE